MRLSGKEKLSFALGAVGKDMVYMLTASYILYYYEDLLGVKAFVMGVILMAARVFDAFNDPVMGVLVAKTRTRWGKFRPWLFWGTILNSVFLFLLFAAPPALDGAGLVAYVSFIYIIWGVTYTMMDIPFWSMIPAFTRGGKERESMSTLGRASAGVGSALITIITMKCVYMLGNGDEAEGFKWFSLIISLLFILFILFTCASIREKSTVNIESPSVKEMFKSLIRNDQAMAIVITIVLINCSIYITTNLLIYFFKYDFGGDDWYNTFGLYNSFGGGMQIAAMILIFPLLRRFFSTTKIFYLSLMSVILGYLIFYGMTYFNMLSLGALLIPSFFIFASNGILLVLTTVFLANTVEYGELKNNRRDESVIFSMQTFVVKLASGAAALIVSICLSIFHLSGEVEGALTEAPADSIAGLRITMTLVPIIGLIAALIYFKKRYILTDEKVEEITSEIRRRNEKEQDGNI